MYRIRKEWNGGKWTKDQKGAYSTLQSAIDNILDEDVMAGYRVFDEGGNIVYPVLDKKEDSVNDLAKKMSEDGVIADIPYWSAVLNGEKQVDSNFLSIVIQRYSDKLAALTKKCCKYTKEVFNGITMYKIDPRDFKIRYIDDVKWSVDAAVIGQLSMNLGYFAGFRENGVYFTLPVANLKADMCNNELPQEAMKYVSDHKEGNKVVFEVYGKVYTSQFNGKYPSTLIVYDKDAEIRNVASFNHVNCNYAVSGAPIIRNGVRCNSYRDEGWDNSITRATMHGFLGIKLGYIYYFYLKTESSNCITSGEVYSKIANFGFSDVIKVDGGGSFFCNDGKTTYSTGGSRRISNIGGVFVE